MPIPAAAPAFPAPQSATTPTTGKQIAQLIHAGPGPAPLHQAATRLHTHAEQLNHTGAQLRSAAGNLQASWFSNAGEAAQGRILELADFYDRHSQTTAAAATQADARQTTCPAPDRPSRVQRSSTSSNNAWPPLNAPTPSPAAGACTYR